MYIILSVNLITHAYKHTHTKDNNCSKEWLLFASSNQFRRTVEICAAL